MRMKPLAAMLLLATLLAGCGHYTQMGYTSAATPQPMPGSDRDAHGCIGSAGYAWCPRTQRCERPWELAKKAGFTNTAEAFRQYCAGENPKPVSP